MFHLLFEHPVLPPCEHPVSLTELPSRMNTFNLRENCYPTLRILYFLSKNFPAGLVTFFTPVKQTTRLKATEGRKEEVILVQSLWVKNPWIVCTAVWVIVVNSVCGMKG